MKTAGLCVNNNTMRSMRKACRSEEPSWDQVHDQPQRLDSKCFLYLSSSCTVCLSVKVHQFLTKHRAIKATVAYNRPKLGVTKTGRKDLQLTLGTYSFIRRERAVVTNNVVHRNTNRECHTTINGTTVNFFGKKLLCLCVDDSSSKLTQINNLGTNHTLSDKALQSQVHNLCSFLILGANITDGVEEQENVSDECKV